MTKYLILTFAVFAIVLFSVQKIIPQYIDDQEKINSLASNPKKRSISVVLNSIFNKEIKTLKQDDGKKKPNKVPKKDFAFKLYKLRKERVQRVCKKYKMKVDEPSPEIFSSILCFSKYEFCYCPNSKTGTTTWMHHFLTKTGLPETLQKKWEDKPGFQKSGSMHQHVRSFFLLPNFLSTDEKKEYLKSYKMVTYVRHPFIRLVSTYKDKVIDHIKFQHWRNFVNYDPTHPYQAFEKFIKQIVNRKSEIAGNWHVSRYWERCDLCNWNYDIIGKMETFSNDTKYIMTQIGMPLEELTYQEHVSTGDPTETLALELFSKLPKDLVKQLYQIYKIDFEMFGYDPKPFL